MAQVITLHHPQNEDVLGLVAPVENKHDFTKFFDAVWKTWEQFNRELDIDACDDVIEDFVEFHNENSEIKIESVINEFIQL